MSSLPAPTDPDRLAALSHTRELLLRWLFWSTTPGRQSGVEPARFGPGEYTASDRARWIAQRKLLPAFRQEAPDAFADVLALARFQLATDLHRMNDDSGDCPPGHPSPLGMLGLWGRTRNLPPERAGHFLFMLFVEGLIETLNLAFSSTTGRTLSELEWAEARLSLYRDFGAFAGSGLSRPEEPVAPEIIFPAWEPTACTESEWRAACESVMSAHVEAQRTARIAMDATLYTTPVAPKAHAHFRWFVRYQVLSESYDDIARQCAGAENRSKVAERVRAGIHSAARLTGIPIRAPGVGGRPKRRAHIIRVQPKLCSS